MPTENRSNNTREQLDALWRDIQDSALRNEDPPHVRFAAALIAHPAEQHQGEPVAYQMRAKTTIEGSEWRPWHECTKEHYDTFVGSPEPNQYGVIRQVRALYTHADPNVRWKAVADEQMQVIDTLHAQLADLKQRHDGLHRDMATIAGREVPKGCTVADYAAAAIADALSASAEPSDECAHSYANERGCPECGEVKS